MLWSKYNGLHILVEIIENIQLIEEYLEEAQIV